MICKEVVMAVNATNNNGGGVNRWQSQKHSQSSPAQKGQYFTAEENHEVTLETVQCCARVAFQPFVADRMKGLSTPPQQALYYVPAHLEGEIIKRMAPNNFKGSLTFIYNLCYIRKCAMTYTMMHKLAESIQSRDDARQVRELLQIFPMGNTGDQWILDIVAKKDKVYTAKSI